MATIDYRADAVNARTGALSRPQEFPANWNRSPERIAGLRGPRVDICWQIGIGRSLGRQRRLVRGSTTSQTRFGDFSSVAIDPQVPGGTCAVATQQYFRIDGTWNTRLARVGNCQPPVLVPNVLNDSLPEAGQVLVSASLTVGQITNVVDPTCNNIGTVLRQNPDPGTPVLTGSAVSLSIGKRPPPPHVCE
jgi:PASTA domain